MGIDYSDHSKEQIKQRKVLLSQIEETVRNPERNVKSFKNRRLRQKRFSGKILEVVTITEGPKITIITAYYLKKESDEN